MEVTTFVFPTVTSIMTLVVAWIALHQKVGIDTLTDLRTQLRDQRDEMQGAKRDIQRLSDEHEACQELLHDTRARYETQVDQLQTENLRLMKRALGLDGP